MEKIERIQGILGWALPSYLQRLYAAHDGQPEGTIALFLNQRWLPLDLALVAWEDLCFRYGKAAPVGQDNNDGCLETLMWSASWLPIFGSPRGDHYCINLDGHQPDQHGQIIWFLYDAPDRPVVARSIAELFWRIAAGVNSGRWRVDDGYDGLCD